MNKGWYVKVETNVVFTVDTNIGVVAPDQFKAERRAIELVERYLDGANFKAELEKTLPWEWNVGGLEWNRGGDTSEIDFDTMWASSVTPDSDFDPPVTDALIEELENLITKLKEDRRE